MLTKILISRKHILDWELEEKLLKICNGFEIHNQQLILWIVQDFKEIVLLLEEAKVPFEVFQL